MLSFQIHSTAFHHFLFSRTCFSLGAYKSLVANECLKIFKSKNETMGKLLQRNYYEHIIKNEKSNQNISAYIINNPSNWKDDKFYYPLEIFSRLFVTLRLKSMATSLNINDILSQVRQLDKEDQLTLLQRLASLLKRTEVTDATSMRLTSLAGLGMDIWKSSNDIDKYIVEERQW